MFIYSGTRNKIGVFYIESFNIDQLFLDLALQVLHLTKDALLSSPLNTVTQLPATEHLRGFRHRVAAVPGGNIMPLEVVGQSSL